MIYISFKKLFPKERPDQRQSHVLISKIKKRMFHTGIQLYTPRE